MYLFFSLCCLYFICPFSIYYCSEPLTFSSSPLLPNRGDECISADPQVRRISAVLDQDQKCHFKKMKLVVESSKRYLFGFTYFFSLFTSRDGAPLLFGTSIQNNGGSVDKLKHHFVMAIYKGSHFSFIFCLSSFSDFFY